jgi:hypothetical protein
LIYNAYIANSTQDRVEEFMSKLETILSSPETAKDILLSLAPTMNEIVSVGNRELDKAKSKRTPKTAKK